MTDPLQAFLQTNGLASAPFAPGSRYHGLPTAEHTRPDGGTKRRFTKATTPPSASFALIQEHEVVAGDRLDNLAAHYLGDPLLFWRLCDANGAMRPDELTAEPGRRLRITLPAGVPGLAGDGGDAG